MPKLILCVKSTNPLVCPTVFVRLRDPRRKASSAIDVFNETQDDTEWIEDEAKLMMCLRHERLVRFIGAGIIDGHKFIVEELMTSS